MCKISQLQGKWQTFAKEFADCYDIDKAAKAAGVNAAVIAGHLEENTHGLRDVVEMLCRRKSLSAEFFDKGALRHQMIKIITSEKETAESRIKCLKYMLDMEGDTKSTGANALAEAIMAIKGNDDEE